MMTMMLLLLLRAGKSVVVVVSSMQNVHCRLGQVQYEIVPCARTHAHTCGIMHAHGNNLLTYTLQKTQPNLQHFFSDPRKTTDVGIGRWLRRQRGRRPRTTTTFSEIRQLAGTCAILVWLKLYNSYTSQRPTSERFKISSERRTVARACCRCCCCCCTGRIKSTHDIIIFFIRLEFSLMKENDDDDDDEAMLS